MSPSETFLYWVGIYTMLAALVFLVCSVSMLVFKCLSYIAGNLYGIRRVIYAIQIVKRWEKRRSRNET